MSPYTFVLFLQGQQNKIQSTKTQQQKPEKISIKAMLSIAGLHHKKKVSEKIF